MPANTDNIPPEMFHSLGSSVFMYVFLKAFNMQLQYKQLCCGTCQSSRAHHDSRTP